MTRRGDLTVPAMPNPGRDAAIDAMVDGLLDELQRRVDRKAWNQCRDCDRYVPCRHHPDAGPVGPIPEEEMQ